jgi:hypothetical protein
MTLLFQPLLFLLSTNVAAQDLSASPTYTTWNLGSGFTPDPVSVNILAGGSDLVTIAGCAGYIMNSAPDARLNFKSGDLPLSIYVNSDADTTLVVNKPDGSWICDDDSGSGTNPVITMSSPIPGQYDIWVGNYNGTDTPAATLMVTELTPSFGNFVDEQTGLTEDLNLAPTNSQPISQEERYVFHRPETSGDQMREYGAIRAVQPTVTNALETWTVRAGGNYTPIHAGCASHVNRNEPSFLFTNNSVSSPITFFAESDRDIDLTLMIYSPEPEYNVLCGNDEHGKNPEVLIEAPIRGEYRIFVGNYNSSARHPVTLGVVEGSEVEWPN